ncbi:MAG: hypothetical protein ACHQ4H_13280 [Ktedonobacterales bacterium]
MPRISLDFNTQDSELVALVTLGQLGMPNGDGLPQLCWGEHVTLCDEAMEVEAIAELGSEHCYRLAAPDWSARHDLASTAST